MSSTLPPFLRGGAPLAFEALPSEIGANAPVQLLFTVPSSHPTNQLVVERWSNGVEQAPVRAWPDGNDPVSGAQRFRAHMPALAPDETADYAPVLTRAGLLVDRMPRRSTRGVRKAAAPEASHGSPPAREAAPRFEWASEFLGAFTVRLAAPPQSSGSAPDGIHLIYSIESGEIRGPKINGKVRGGDWVLLRRDGIGIAESRITCETDDGALLLSRYSGVIDLGPDGFDRALRNDFAPFPPAVLTPQFVTSHHDWVWLNRLQCIAVGRANLPDLVVRFDIHAIRVGQPVAR